MAVQLSAGIQPISGRVTKFRYNDAVDEDDDDDDNNNNNNAKSCE